MLSKIRYPWLIGLAFLAMVLMYTGLSVGRLLLLLDQSLALALVTIGVTWVMLTSRYHMAAGSLVALAGALLLHFQEAADGVWLMVCGGVVYSLLGVMIGSLVLVSRVHSLLITFGLMWVFEGVASLLFTQLTASPVRSPLLVGDWSVTFVVGLVLLMVLVVSSDGVLRWSRLGVQVRLVEQNAAEAERAGVCLWCWTLWSFALTGVLCWVAARHLLDRSISPTLEMGSGYAVFALISVFLGKMFHRQQRLTFVGSFMGALTVTIVRNDLDYFGVGLSGQRLILGVMLMVTAYCCYVRRRSHPVFSEFHHDHG